MAKFLLVLLGLITSEVWASNEDLQARLRQLQIPPGFKISLYADSLPSARSMALGDEGVIYIGSRDGKVYAVKDADSDGYAEQRYVIADNLYLPNGVAYKNKTLYVAEVNRIIRFENINEHLTAPEQPKVVFDQFPSDKHHGWKYLRFGLDGKLYTAVGVPCNICEPKDAMYGSLVRLNTDGTGFEILANGIRNSVGFDWQPNTGNLFFHDNGRDYLGDDLPPEELNQWSFRGEHFGFPYCHAGTIPDPDIKRAKACEHTTAPVWKYQAHIAPLGMRFYTGKQFPKTYHHQLLVAQHGSWNRNQPAGYQIALVKFDNGRPVAEESFINGWLQASGEAWGRPVDLLQLADGSLLISDDKAGAIYRVQYQP